MRRKPKELEEDRNNLKTFFKHCRRFKRGFKPQTLFLKNDPNNLFSESRDIEQHFRIHFDTT